ncbi:hypothetical protein NMD85_11020 [Edwardsiella tarda]
MNQKTAAQSEQPITRRAAMGKGVRLAVAGVGLAAVGSTMAQAASGAKRQADPYAEPKAYGLPRPGSTYRNPRWRWWSSILRSIS